MAEQGYGAARWQREAALWRGTLRRLQRQAEGYPTPPPWLQSQIDHAQQRLDAAEAQSAPKRVPKFVVRMAASL